MERGFRRAFKHFVAVLTIHPLEHRAKEIGTKKWSQLEAEREANQFISIVFSGWNKTSFFSLEHYASF